MPPVELQVQSNQDENPEETMSSKPIIGIIYPPPEVRNIVDKTASFVARNGPEFENRIRSNEINNPKFNFLTTNDPYHAYYQHKVKEFKEGKGQEPAVPKPGIPLGLAQKTILEQVKIIEPIVPKEPPPEFEFIADPPSISAFDLDIVRLTAQFVARNGRQFLTNLMNKESRNYQFDFLRPQHSLFNYFTKLVEHYTKILIPPKDLLGKLRKEADNPKLVLEQVKYRVEWIRFQEREKQKEEAAQEKERVAYAQIDWHDFVVVETVDFQQNETGNLPPPTTPEEVGARMLRQERIDKGEGAMEMDSDEEEEEEEDEKEEEEEKTKKKPKEKPSIEMKKTSKVEPAPPVPKEKPVENKEVKHMEVIDMEEDSEPSDVSDESDEEREKEKEKEKDKAPPPPQPEETQPALPPLPPPPPSEIPQPPLPPAPGQVLIKKDYNPKSRTVTPQEVAASGDALMVSPITGEKIPAHKVKEHMRIGLLDPKWIEQRNRAMEEKKEQEDVYAPGTSIEKSLKQLAERRTDIFGIGVEETQIGKKIGEEEKKERKIVWDGHTASMEKVTQKARENISIEQQIAVIHKVKGLVPDEEKEKIGPAAPKPPHGRPPAPPPSTRPSVPLPPPPPPKSVPPPPPVSAPVKPPAPPPPKTSVRPLLQPPNVMVMPRPPPPGQRPILGQPPRMPVPVPPRGFQPPMGMRPPPPPMAIPKLMQDKGDDEPPNKRAKTEDSLIPEEEFLARNRSPVTFKVAIPHLPDKSEWNLAGQLLTFSLPLTDAVSVVKAKLNEALGMPAGKQKLQVEGMFVKDSNTLAFYNFTPRTVVNLQLKERGGRKK